VLIEGFKSLPIPKIEIRKEDDPMPLPGNGEQGTIAIVTDGAAAKDRLPTFRRDDIGAIAVFIAGRVRVGR
jgi:molybdopterin-guanine dinucleotide biosynthesis protein B